AMAAKAAPIFTTTCAACHGKDGTGNQGLGAPDLTDDVWKWGGSVEAIHATIHDGRQGHMPHWDARLTDSQIHVLAAYVYHLSQQGHERRPKQPLVPATHRLAGHPHHVGDPGR